MSCKHPKTIVREIQAEVLLHLGVPDARDISNGDVALHKGLLDHVSQNNVQRVCHFISLDANETRLDSVECIVKLLRCNILKFLVRGSLKLLFEVREGIGPEWLM